MSSQNPVAAPRGDGFPPPDPFHWHAKPTLAERYRVMGFNVLIETNDQRIIDAARWIFFPSAPSVDSDQPIDLRVVLMHHATSDDPQWKLDIPIVRTNGAYITLTYSRHSSMVVDVRRGEVFGFITEALASRSDYLGTDVVLPAVILWIYILTNGFVHAGGVTDGSRSVIVRGRSGMGKSTLVYAMVRRGYALIGDDSIYVRSRNTNAWPRLGMDGPRFFSLPWMLMLLPDSVRFFPELADAPVFVRPSGEEKLIVDAVTYYPDRVCSEAPAGPLVFLERTSEPRSSIRQIARDEVIARLKASTFAYEPDSTEPGSLWGLFLEYPTYVLSSGVDPNEAAATLDAVLRAAD